MLSQFLKSADPIKPAPILQSFTSTTIVGGTSGTINKPSGTNDGDLLVFFAASSVTRTTIPVGFTPIGGAGTTKRMAYKIAAGEPSSYTFTTGISQDTSAVMIRLSGAAYYQIGAFGTNAASPITSGSTTAKSSYSLVLMFLNNTSTGVSFTVPTQYTSVYSENSAGSVSMAVHKLVVPTSTVASQSVTMSGGVGGGFHSVFSPT